jgi:hypothetical protein
MEMGRFRWGRLGRIDRRERAQAPADVIASAVRRPESIAP